MGVNIIVILTKVEELHYSNLLLSIQILKLDDWILTFEMDSAKFFNNSLPADVEYGKLELMKTKPVEEFYDLANDPYEVHNIIDNSIIENTLDDMNKSLQKQ